MVARRNSDERHRRPELGDAPPAVVDKVRGLCLRLPETYEEPAWVGTRWRIRTRTVAHVFTMDTADGSIVAVMFRSAGPELEVLRAIGHPYFAPEGWRNAVMLAIDERTDWVEVGELLTESYCLLAPKKLVVLLDRPDAT